MNLSFLRRHPFRQPKPAPVHLAQESRASRRQRTMEIGVGGVSYISGIINSDEFNAKLTGRDGVETYDKMRTDAQVAATINACQLPILAADWGIDRPEDDSEAEKISDEHLDFARENLFTRINFQTFLTHACSCLWAGFSWFEQVYAVRDGYWWIASLSPRLATTLDRWTTDPNGRLSGIVQWVYQDGRYTYVEYPRDKIALFVFGQEANNYQGRSLLRPMYKHWFIKDVLYKIDAIRNERFAIGVPVITLPDEHYEELFTMAQEIGEKWKGAEQSYVVKVKGMEIEILQTKGGEALDLIPTIQHHNEEIPKVGLAQFLNFGLTQTGSRSLGETTTSFFYDAEGAWADQLARTIEREILWPLMDMNFAGQIRPQVTYADLGAISLGAMVETLEKVGELYVRPRLDIENALRSRLNLAPLVDEKKTAAEQPVPRPPGTAVEVEEEPADDGTATAVARRPGIEALARSTYWRPLRDTEANLDLTKIQDRLDQAQRQIMLILLGTRDEWSVALAKQLQENWAGGPQAIARTTIPALSLVEPRQQLIQIETDLFRFGQEQVFKEIQKQAKTAKVEVSIPPVQERLRDTSLELPEVDALVETRVEILLTRLSRTTEEAAWQIAIGQYRTRGPDDLSEADTQELLASIFSRVEREAQLIASMSVTETFNLGRDFGFKAIADDLKAMEYSAIMDDRTCSQCYPLDGKRVAYGTPEYYDLQPPLQSQRYGSCEGRSRCRCIWVGVLKIERS